MKIREGIDTDLDIIAQNCINKAWKRRKKVDLDTVKSDIQDVLDDRSLGTYIIAEDDSEGVVGCMGVMRVQDDYQEQWHYAEPEYRKTGLVEKMRNYFTLNQ